MDESQVASAIASFLDDDLDLGLEKTYPYPLSNTTGKLPDVVVFVEDTADAIVPPEGMFPGQDLQEAWWRVFTVTCSFMVEVAEQTEAAAEAAWHQVEAIVASVRQGVAADLTLGDRLIGETVCSPFLHFDFSEPFISREDQTRGRHFNLNLLVASRIAAPEAGFWPGS